MNFTDIKAFESFVVDFFNPYTAPLQFTVKAIPCADNGGDCCSDQFLKLAIDGATELQMCIELFETLIHEGYDLFITTQDNPAFEMVGFKHVTVEGVANYWTYMDSNGTVGMLWDCTNQERIDMLMLKGNFNMTTYITDKWNVEVGSPLFEDIMLELHDELVDARFALEYAYSAGFNDVDCMGFTRYFRNLNALPQSEEWNPKSYYPQSIPTEFICHADLEAYAIEETVKRSFYVTVTATSEEYEEIQKFDFFITGANACNCLGAIDDALRGHDYETIVYTVK
jgi:hypothetical protein